MKMDSGQSMRPIADRQARGMYLRALAGWALDVLTDAPPTVWKQTDAFADFRNRNWQHLYSGSILDD